MGQAGGETASRGPTRYQPYGSGGRGNPREELVRIACALALAAGSMGLAGSGQRARHRRDGSRHGQQHASRIISSTRRTSTSSTRRAAPATTSPSWIPSRTKGSAKNLTWTIVLPSDGAELSSLLLSGSGGTVNDPGSLFDQAFQELQFYPDTVVTECTPAGTSYGSAVPNAFTACSPVWQVVKRTGSTSRTRPSTRCSRREQRPAAHHARRRHGEDRLLRDRSQGRLAHHRQRPDHGPQRHDRPEQLEARPAQAGLRHADGRQLARSGASSTTRRPRSCGRSGTPTCTLPPGKFCLPGDTGCGTLRRGALGGHVAAADRVGAVRAQQGDDVGRGERLRRRRRGPADLQDTASRTARTRGSPGTASGSRTA